MRRFLVVLSLFLALGLAARAQGILPVIDVESARRAGAAEGERAGQQEGESRGRREGEEKGYREGRDRGYRDRRDELCRLAYEDGLREGRNVGSFEGRQRGEADGRTAGLVEGRLLGEREGEARARQEAEHNAQEPATRAAWAEAEASDASERGRQEGSVEGDALALKKAKDVDHPRGRAEYHRQRTAEPVRATVPIQAGPSAWRLLPVEVDDGFVQTQGSGGGYSTPEETQAWRKAYDAAYERGRRSSYDSFYRRTYDQAFSRGREEGRREAERLDYFGDRRRGYDQGYREEYDANYTSSRVTSMNQAMAEEGARVSAEVYARLYPGFYQADFGRIKAEAFSARYDALRTAAREAARDLTMARNYPEYARTWFQKGRVDEKADLAARPLRIVEAGFEARSASVEGLARAPLGLNLQVRNYGDERYASGRVTLEIVQGTPGSAYLPTPRLTVNREFPDRVVLAGKDLAEVQVRREFADQDLEFEVRVLVDRQVMDSFQVKVPASVGGTDVPGPTAP